jgi:hypothetical protein
VTAATHDLTAAIRRVEARSSRSRQRELGASEIGTCRRRTAYRLAGTPETNGGTGLQATLGHWIHKGALAVLRQEYGALIEVRLASPLIRGHADALYLDPSGIDDPVLEDVKTRGRFVYATTVDKGPREAELFQLHVYAWLLRNGHVADRRRGYPTGPVPVEHLRLRFIDRDTGANHVWETDYDPAVTAEALGWLAGVLEGLETGGPEAVPRDGHGPDVSAICDYCPFLDACWGPQPLGPNAPTRQSLQVRDDVEIEAALAEYDRGRALASEGAAIKKRERAFLDGAQPGVYGLLSLSWSQSAPKLVPDVEWMIEMLEGMDTPVPMKWTDGTRTISVRPAKTPEAQRKE